MVGTLHQQAVEMKTGGLVAELVVEMDDNLVVHIGVDGGNRPLAVDSNDRPLESTIWIRRGPSDVEVIGDSFGVDCGHEGGKERRCRYKPAA